MLAQGKSCHQSSAGTRKGLVTRKGVQGGTVSKNETGREMVYQGRTQRQVTGTTATNDTARGGWGKGRTNMIAGKEVTIFIRLISVLFAHLKVLLSTSQS